MPNYCCYSMEEQFEIEREEERLVSYSKEQDEFGLRDRKDDEIYTPISFCPWCGTSLTGRLSPDHPYENRS
jgi:hypothetical protein